MKLAQNLKKHTITTINNMWNKSTSEEDKLEMSKAISEFILEDFLYGSHMEPDASIIHQLMTDETIDSIIVTQLQDHVENKLREYDQEV